MIIAVNYYHHVPGPLHTIYTISEKLGWQGRGRLHCEPLWLIHRGLSSISKNLRDGPGLSEHPPLTDEEAEVQRGKAAC